MSTRTTDSTNCPRPTPFDKAEQLIHDLAQLEAGITTEVQRLEYVNAPAAAAPEYRGRPIWWWRVMLVSWAWSPETERFFALDALKGLRIVLKEWDDEVLVGFLDGLLSDAAASPAA